MHQWTFNSTSNSSFSITHVAEQRQDIHQSKEGETDPQTNTGPEGAGQQMKELASWCSFGKQQGLLSEYLDAESDDFLLIPGLEDGEEESMFAGESYGYKGSAGLMEDEEGLMLSYTNNKANSTGSINLNIEPCSILDAELADMQEKLRSLSHIHTDSARPAPTSTSADLLSSLLSNDHSDTASISMLIPKFNSSSCTNTISETSCMTHEIEKGYCINAAEDNYIENYAPFDEENAELEQEDHLQQIMQSFNKCAGLNITGRRSSSADHHNSALVCKPSSEGLMSKKRIVARAGPWKPEEDIFLRKLVERYGDKKWSVIAQHLQGRIGKQCRERWQNQLRPDIKREGWTVDELKQLVSLHRRLGSKWAAIAKYMPGRTENNIKNVWNATKRRKDTRSGKSRSSSRPASSTDDGSYSDAQHSTNSSSTSILRDYIKELEAQKHIKKVSRVDDVPPLPEDVPPPPTTAPAPSLKYSAPRPAGASMVPCTSHAHTDQIDELDLSAKQRLLSAQSSLIYSQAYQLLGDSSINAPTMNAAPLKHLLQPALLGAGSSFSSSSLPTQLIHISDDDALLVKPSWSNRESMRALLLDKALHGVSIAVPDLLNLQAGYPLQSYAGTDLYSGSVLYEGTSTKDHSYLSQCNNMIKRASELQSGDCSFDNYWRVPLQINEGMNAKAPCAWAKPSASSSNCSGAIGLYANSTDVADVSVSGLIQDIVARGDNIEAGDQINLKTWIASLDENITNNMETNSSPVVSREDFEKCFTIHDPPAAMHILHQYQLCSKFQLPLQTESKDTSQEPLHSALLSREVDLFEMLAVKPPLPDQIP